MLLGLTIYAWITVFVVITIFSLLIFTKLPAEFVFLAGIGVFLLTGVLDAEAALAGFSSTSVVVIGVLFVVVAGMEHTGFLQWIMRYVLGTPSSLNKAIVKLMLTVASLSSILSNTTVVAMFVNVVKMWGKRLNIPPSKLLIPLSYASGMGGICTILGTPPNLIISGMYAEQTGEHMNIFVTTIPGLFCLAVGILSILAMRRLLPKRKAPEDVFANTEDYTMEFLVPSDSKYIGSTLAEAGMTKVPGGQLLEVISFDKEVVSPVPDDMLVVGGDRLVYCGQINELIDLRESRGLLSVVNKVFAFSNSKKKRQLHTASVCFNSPLVNNRWGDVNIRGIEDVTLVAVSRHGERLCEVPSEIVLQPGDTVLLEYSPKAKYIERNFKKALEFFDEDEVLTRTGWPTVVSSLIMLGMILLSSLNIMTLLQSSVLAALLMVIFRCCTPQQAMRSINWNILMIFASSVVLGSAIQNTGLAEMLANVVVGFCDSNPLLLMFAVCLVATFTTEFVSNAAAGAMFYPIVYQAATSMGCDPFPFLIALMISVSSSFATPIGSPTHMLVYGPGGYRFTDFVRIGFWMNLIILAANIFIVNVLWPVI